MLTRREMLSTGVAGGFGAGVVGEVTLEQNAAQLTEIAKKLDELESSLTRALDGPSALEVSFVNELRKNMIVFMKANQKFPDFIDIGMNVFIALYDYHVRNRLQIVVTRAMENRYTMQFMFSMLVLRPEQDANFIGFPYDKG